MGGGRREEKGGGIFVAYLLLMALRVIWTLHAGRRSAQMFSWKGALIRAMGIWGRVFCGVAFRCRPDIS
jgi:hypothetical protein